MDAETPGVILRRNGGRIPWGRRMGWLLSRSRLFEGTSLGSPLEALEASNRAEWRGCRHGQGPVRFGEAAEMIPHSDSVHAERRRVRFAIGEFLYRVSKVFLVAVLVILIFLLGQSMVRHRFFQGGRYHANGSVGQ